MIYVFKRFAKVRQEKISEQLSEGELTGSKAADLINQHPYLGLRHETVPKKTVRWVQTPEEVGNL